MGARIAIVGAGAVGGYAGAHMAQAGEDVTFVDFWPENVETIRARGLRISHLRDCLGRCRVADAKTHTHRQRSELLDVAHALCNIGGVDVSRASHAL